MTDITSYRNLSGNRGRFRGYSGRTGKLKENRRDAEAQRVWRLVVSDMYVIPACLWRESIDLTKWTLPEACRGDDWWAHAGVTIGGRLQG